ncbi:family 16 glycosylhydrolase [Cellulophaga baltica]|uniref:family 16 glycosylhydrolase n=1 Tax=Cellulophaga baltica TaxID=76594 RepID=UPI002494F801|nr:family 16 glycosylhydrolase [Cellulophaga baltica]
MKHIYLLASLLSLMIFSCKQDNNSIDENDQDEVSEEPTTDPVTETPEETAPEVVDYTTLTPPTPPEGMKWVAVSELTDEFNDTFDTDKWFKPLWNYDVPVNMKAENAGVADGNLWIKATLDDTQERWFLTSRVQSKAQINYPMYTESSIKTAHISAYNTFWLNNGDISDRNEIDIIENNSKPSCDCQPDFPWQMNSQYFHVVDGDTRRNKGNFDNRTLSDDNPLKGVRWNEEYHTVGVYWKDAKNIQFYLDGEPAGSVVSERDFTRDLNVIWDLWTFDVDWLGGLAVKTDLTDETINTMKVDWIHTYQLVAE